ncbi:MAG TPA: GYD domain-containing protein [Micropepsaceae bacterium]|nr:GYD domain-containing protein [Micropepsaceae bacterium]
MPKFLVEASYTGDGLKNLQKDRAEGRAAALKAAMQSLGGKLEAIYWCLGEHDVIAVADLPDLASAAAIGIAASASGMVRTTTTQLLTAQELDEALSKGVNYRAPGQK